MFMKQELWQDGLRLPRFREVAALYTEHIQKPNESPDYLLGEVTQPSDSRLSETSGHLLSQTTKAFVELLHVSSGFVR